VVKCLPSKREALNLVLNPHYTHTERERERERERGKEREREGKREREREVGREQMELL
jgi:hypothetical protein